MGAYQIALAERQEVLGVLEAAVLLVCIAVLVLMFRVVLLVQQTLAAVAVELLEQI